MFRIFLFCFLFFVLFMRVDVCLGWLVVFSMSRILNNELYSFFLIFLNLIFYFQTTSISQSVAVFHTLCPYSSYPRLYHSSLVLAPIFLFVFLNTFSVVKKLNDLSFFLVLRHFFCLQLISFKTRQYWEFAKRTFPKFLLITVYCNFLQALVLFLNDSLPFNFILLLMSFLWLT